MIRKYESYEEGLDIFSKKINLDDNIFKIFKNISAKTDRRPSGSTFEKMFKNFDEGKRLVELLNSKEFSIGNYSKL